MRSSTSKAWSLALCAAVAAFLLGWWIGEYPGWPLPFVLIGWVLGSEKSMYVSFALATVSVAVFVAFTTRRVWPAVWARRGAAVATALSLASGVWLGGTASSRAFNECVREADRIRDEIVAFKSAHGRYPGELTELSGGVPCQRPLRGSLLSYATTASGFTLQFNDWLVTHEGNERRGMYASQ